MSKLGIPINWITPSDLNITQYYYTSKQNKVSINFAGKNHKIVLKEWEEKIDQLKQNSAIIPNIIYSLDASHLINVVNTVNEFNKNIYGFKSVVLLL